MYRHSLWASSANIVCIRSRTHIAEIAYSLWRYIVQSVDAVSVPYELEKKSLAYPFELLSTTR